MRSALAAVTVASLATSSVAGTVLFVDGDAASGGNGSSWLTAYRFPQDALAAADGLNGVEIRVAEGTYRPDRSEASPTGTGDRTTTFILGDGVVMRGGFSGIGAADPDERDVARFETVLSGDLLGDDESGWDHNDENSWQVVSAVGVSVEAMLDGFTITAGHADGPDNLVNNVGAAVYMLDAEVRLRQCTVAFNESGHGVVWAEFGRAMLIDCRFLANREANQSGALWLRDCSGNLLLGCTFDATMPEVPQCAFANFRSQTAVLNCTFSGYRHVQFRNGGGCVNNQNGDIVLANCEFSGHQAGIGAAFMNTLFGEGVSGSAILSNCVFSGNLGIGPAGGAAVYNGYAAYPQRGPPLWMDNCILWENAAPNADVSLRDRAATCAV